MFFVALNHVTGILLVSPLHVRLARLVPRFRTHLHLHQSLLRLLITTITTITTPCSTTSTTPVTMPSLRRRVNHLCGRSHCATHRLSVSPFRPSTFVVRRCVGNQNKSEIPLKKSILFEADLIKNN